ncbi:MAG: bifunctional folylpolyglutamate synthase/dihydrofolate synthase, partial [Thermoanaerobaculia bacterium]
MRALLAALGDPQLQYRTVLVAGSNGKGSTSALLAAMASAAGLRTGLYTSPHLESVEERLRIDGRAIDPGDLAGLLERI